MKPQTVIVIGASAGGVEALGVLVGGLPADLPAAILVVLHIGAHKSDLPGLLNRVGRLRAAHPADEDEVSAGQIYVAPPDHHMTLEDGRVRLTKGPRENFSRPAIDPLFRSAAADYGADVIGVILTGGLNDGTAGLYEVKLHGGVAIVQDPGDAQSPSMPRSALAHVAVDHCEPLTAIAPLLVRLVSERAVLPHRHPATKTQVPEMTGEFTLNHPVAVTCPDCGGALRETNLGTITMFECHIGHRYTAEVMLAGQFLAMERFIESAMRSLNERAELCRQMAEKISVSDAGDKERWLEAMQEAEDQTAPLRLLLDREWVHPLNDGFDDLLVS
jgi:two-component system chemotaxis response regulator CheB